MLFISFGLPDTDYRDDDANIIHEHSICVEYLSQTTTVVIYINIVVYIVEMPESA